MQTKLTIGERMKDLRVEKGLTLEALGQRLAEADRRQQELAAAISQARQTAEKCRQLAACREELAALEARGLLKRDATKPRALELFNEDGSSVSISKSDEPTAPRGTVSLPLVGRVAAGIPILAEQNIEDTFTIPTEIATDQGSFILEVHGSSMINVGIFNGDYIIVREQKSAMNGEIVVAMIDGSATVKTFYKEQGRVRLQPENDTMEPIYATNPAILGKVVGLMRRFS